MKLTSRDMGAITLKLVETLLKPHRWIKDRVSGLVQRLVITKPFIKVHTLDCDWVLIVCIGQYIFKIDSPVQLNRKAARRRWIKIWSYVPCFFRKTEGRQAYLEAVLGQESNFYDIRGFGLSSFQVMSRPRTPKKCQCPKDLKNPLERSQKDES